MSTAFDPYYKWLGIPPQEQPPHFYRLLGITLFEPDKEVIAAAADRLISQLQTQATGQLAAYAQRLLNEVAAAKVCLLTPQQRAEYDSRLRAALQIDLGASTDALARLMALDASAPILSLPQQQAAPTKRKKSASRAGSAPVERYSELGPLVDRPTWLAPLALLVLILLTIGVVGGILVKNSGDEPPPPRDPPLVVTPNPTQQPAAAVPTGPPATPTEPPAAKQPHLIPVQTLTGHQGGVETVAFLSDGLSAVSAGNDRFLHRWDLASGNETGVHRGHEARVNALAVSPQGDRIASGGGQAGVDEDGSVRIWNAADRIQVARIAARQGEVCRGVAYSPDGSAVLSAHSGGKVYLSNATNGSLVRTYIGHTGDVKCVAFAADGQRFASGSSDHTIRLWELGNLRSVRSFGSPETVSMALSFLPDGNQILSAEDDGILRVWDSSDGGLVRAFSGTNLPLGGPKQPATAVALTPDGTRALSAHADGTLRLWDVAEGTEIERAPAHQGVVLCLALSRDGQQILTGGADGAVRLWRLETAAAAP